MLCLLVFYVQSEMESFLETAGFSRDNPYYMVEQGSVKQICELSDAGRLRLLKEVAGTRVYEDRRRESEAVLEDTKQKVDQVNDLINDMKASLSVHALSKESHRVGAGEREGHARGVSAVRSRASNLHLLPLLGGYPRKRRRSRRVFSL